MKAKETCKWNKNKHAKKKEAIADSVIWSHMEIFEQLLHGQFYISFHL